MIRINFKQIGILCISLILLISSAYGVTITGSTDEAGFSTSVSADSSSGLSSTTVLSSEGVSGSLTGLGDIKQDHWVVNQNKDTARVGINLTGSTGYTYSYTMLPGEGAVTSDIVEAMESLDVTYAEYINAYAQARTGLGDSVNTGIDVTRGSLDGYSNRAVASSGRLESSQGFSRASGDDLKVSPLSGTISGPILKIPEKAKAKLPWKVISKLTDYATDAAITTVASGTIADYSDSVVKSSGSSKLAQSSHITGSFESNASAVGAPYNVRTSNYGAEYGMEMKASTGTAPETSGVLAYYINPSLADTISGNGAIQGAVISAQPGDTIVAAAGEYKDNVQVDKSLTIRGSGKEATIVDGNKSGTTLTIASGANLALSDMTIKNGSAEYGAGIYNSGTLTANNLTISQNNAGYLGGGIYNLGYITLKDSAISNNSANKGAGVFNEYTGTVILSGSAVSNNKASVNAGGIWNSGILIAEKNSAISDNIATTGNGGGLYNTNQATITDSSITGNHADQGRGAGFWNSGSPTGFVSLKETTVSGNYAREASDIASAGTVILNSPIGYHPGSYSAIVTVNQGAKTQEGVNLAVASGKVNVGPGTFYENVLIDKSLTVAGSGKDKTTVNGRQMGSVFSVTNSGANVVLSGMKITNGKSQSGGGVKNDGTVTVKDSDIVGNWAMFGGGVYSNYGRRVTIVDSTISGNTASQLGGGFWNYGPATITNSTFSNNWAQYGGGLMNYGSADIAGSTSLGFNSGREDFVSVNTILSQGLLENRIAGTGSFKENHWINNEAGDQAGVGVNITDADIYNYDYILQPGEQGNQVARENLNVDNAKRVEAFAEARGPYGRNARSEISITRGSLKSYSNAAWISNTELNTAQQFSRAEGDLVRALSWGSSENRASRVSIAVSSGYLKDYSDQSRVMSDFSREVTNSNLYGHISISHDIGNFTSTSISKQNIANDGSYNQNGIYKQSIRTSNYGTEYDLNAISRSDKNKEDLEASGLLTYYVDITNPEAKSIQGAIDSALSGDSIAIAPGIYYEGLRVNKSLKMRGSGSDKTFIDGNNSSRVLSVDRFTNFDLSGLTIRNGFSLYNGGGIHNSGNLTITDCNIERNRVFDYSSYIVVNPLLVYKSLLMENGGGIYNDGTIIMNSGNIRENECLFGGGVYNKGTFIMNGGNIYKNKALWLYKIEGAGGGGYNEGTFIMNDGAIYDNIASRGGVMNFKFINGGVFKLNGGYIYNNVARWGGGIDNAHGDVDLNGGEIYNNTASVSGGGIWNQYTIWDGLKGNRSIVHGNHKGNITSYQSGSFF